MFIFLFDLVLSMKEGQSGSSSREGKQVFPPDSEKYDSTCSYDFFISKQEQSIMIKTTEYHPGMLYITKSDLEKMIRDLEK